MKKKECSLCGRVKDWKGDDIVCPFSTEDSTPLTHNWRCGILQQIRSLKDLENPNIQHNMVWDTNILTINISSIFVEDEFVEDIPLTLWIAWYKNRGKTDQVALLGNFPSRPPTFRELKKIVEFFKNTK